MARSRTKGVAINKLAGTEEEIFQQIGVYLKRSGLGDGASHRRMLEYAYRHGGHFKKSEIPFRIDVKVLNRLVKAGFLSRVIVGNNKRSLNPFYESTIGKKLHSHFYCDTCEKITDFDDTLVRELSEKICNYFEHEKHYMNFQINGECKECREK